MRHRPSCVGPSVAFQDISFDSLEGFTPLRVAILSRNWETARVIIAIATAQYEAPAGVTTYNHSSGKLLARVPIQF